MTGDGDIGRPGPEATRQGRAWRDAWALGFAMVYPTFLAWVYFVALARTPNLEHPAPDTAERARNPLAVAAWGTGKVLQFAFPLLWVWGVERTRVRLTRPTFRGLEWGLGFGVLTAVLLFGLYFGLLRHTHSLKDTPARLHDKVAEFGVGTPVLFVGFVAFLLVGHSLLEEYYWRWFVFGRLRNHLRLPAAIGLSGVAFMAYHVINLSVFFPGKFWALAVPLSACVAVGGAFFAWLYDRTGSIYAPWVAHLIIDAAIMAVGYDLVFRY